MLHNHPDWVILPNPFFVTNSPHSAFKPKSSLHCGWRACNNKPIAIERPVIIRKEHIVVVGHDFLGAIWIAHSHLMLVGVVGIVCWKFHPYSNNNKSVEVALDRGGR